MTTTVRVSDSTHARLVVLAAATGHRMQAVVDDAVALYEANAFWQEFTAGYERISGDPAQWEEVQAERNDEAAVLRDGLG